VRIVIDTNVLISGLLVRGSVADQVRRAWERGGFELVTSERQLDEIRRVSRYPRLAARVRPHEFGRLVGRMRRHAIVLPDLPSIHVSPDPDDDAIVATALAGGATWLVTGDAGHLLALGNFEAITIASPKAFLEATGPYGPRR